MCLLGRIGGVTILRKGKSDLISDGETGNQSDDFVIIHFHVFLYINVLTLCLNNMWLFFFEWMSNYKLV